MAPVWYNLLVAGLAVLGPVGFWQFISNEKFQGGTNSTLFSQIAEPLSRVPVGNLSLCTGQSPGSRICNIKNMCYSNNYHAFVLAYSSEGRFLPSERILLTVKELAKLTPVLGQRLWFSYIAADRDHMESMHPSKVLWPGKYYILGQFAANNIAHDIHDILLPIFHALNDQMELLGDSPSRTLMTIGDVPLEASVFMYSLFSKYPPFIFRNAVGGASLVCFEDITVGLPTDTAWYQWGLENVPEGPLNNSDVTSEHILKFTRYVRQKLSVEDRCDNKEFGILFSRKGTRRLINEKNLKEAISTGLRIDVMELSFEQNTIRQIIQAVSCAKFIAGAHGSILSLGIFLPPYGVVLEMFPYALNPKDYTQCKTWVEMNGMKLKYVAWRNMNQSNTVVHSFEGLYPGLVVSKEEQDAILKSGEVAPHLCCDDAAFRFRANQDTIVDSPAVVKLLKGAYDWQLVRKITQIDEH